MDNIINFPCKDSCIEFERTESFHKAARELGDYIKGLPLITKDNYRLVYLIIEQIHFAEQGAFERGFEMGVKLLKNMNKGAEI